MSSKNLVEITGRVRVRSLVFLEICDLKCFLTGGDDGMIRQYRIDDGVEVGQAIETGQAIAAMAVSGDGEWIVSSGRGVVNVLKRTDPGRQIHHTVTVSDSEHLDWVDTVDISPDSTKLATGSNDKKAVIWDLPTGQRLVGPLQHTARVASVRFSPDGARIVTSGCTASSGLRIYDVHNGDLLKIIPTSVTSYPNPITWSGDSSLFALVSLNTLMHIDVNTEQTFSSWTVPGESVNGDFGSIALSSNHRFIAAFVGRAISLWDASTSARVSSDTHPAPICAIALSSKSNHLAISDANGKITIRDLKDFVASYYLADPDVVQQPRTTSRRDDDVQLQYEAVCEKLRELELRLGELSGPATNNLPQEAQPVPLRVSDGVYHIKSITGDLYLAYPQDRAGTVVAQPLGESNVPQRWTVSLSTDGAYNIMGRRGDSNVPLSAGNANALVCGQGCVHAAWTIEPRGISYIIGNAVDATAVHLRECRQCVSVSLRDNTRNQRWVFERVAD